MVGARLLGAQRPALMARAAVSGENPLENDAGAPFATMRSGGSSPNCAAAHEWIRPLGGAEGARPSATRRDRACRPTHRRTAARRSEYQAYRCEGRLRRGLEFCDQPMVSRASVDQPMLAELNNRYLDRKAMVEVHADLHRR
jgi:hypothetical protein